jgi:uncharacterized coiled-coil DUF342 family protein
VRACAAGSLHFLPSFLPSAADNRNWNLILQAGSQGMTDEEVERAIESLLNHHAKVSADIQEFKEAQKITTATVASLASQADADRREMRETIEGLVEEMRDRYNSAIDEMRDGFNKLILANEITRDLISQVARLEIGTNQRVTAIEEKLAT